MYNICPAALRGFQIRAILSRNKIISITCPPRQLWTWEYYRQNHMIKLHFMRHQWRVLEYFPKNMGFYPSSDRIVEINAQTLESGTWRWRGHEQWLSSWRCRVWRGRHRQRHPWHRCFRHCKCRATVHSTKAQAYCPYQWTERGEGTGSCSYVLLLFFFFKYLLYFVYVDPKTHWSLPQMSLGTARH